MFLYSNVMMFISVCFGTVSEKRISNTVSDLTLLELLAVIVLILHAVMLLTANVTYFDPFIADMFCRFTR